jgi:hypothetical protein
MDPLLACPPWSFQLFSHLGTKALMSKRNGDFAPHWHHLDTDQDWTGHFPMDF